MRELIFVFFFSVGGTAFANETDFKMDSIQQLTENLKKARENEDLERQIELTYALFVLSSNSIFHNQTYVYSLELESLMDGQDSHPIFQKIKYPFFSKMGRLLNVLGEYENSLIYYQKAIEIADKNGLVEASSRDRGAVAFNLYLLGKKKEAKISLDHYLEEAMKLDNNELISDAHFRFYTIYIDTLPELALFHSRQSLNTSNLREFSHRNINMGTCFINLKQPDSALYYTEKGLHLAKENGFQIQESNALILLRNIYSEMGDYQKALESFEKYFAIQNISRSFGSGMKLMALDLDILEEKLALQESLTEEKLTNQRLLLWIFVIFTMTLGIILMLLYKKIILINQQKKRIEDEKIRAEQSEKYVEQFLINLSHEIRTPMHAISGMINALLRNPESNFKGEYMKAMRISSDNLLTLINDILDLAKIESGKMELNLEEFKPALVALGAVHSLKFKASEKGLELTTEIAEDFPENIIADPSRLSQILINLLGNAIKFTEHGKIRLILSKVDEYARFEVQDTGIGIPEDKQQLIFKSFEQLGKEPAIKYEGTGLGLSISKKLIELQEGKIRVESEQGKGSRFIFELPIHNGQVNLSGSKIKPKLDLENLGQKLQGIRILLVDDDEFNMMVVQDDLTFFIPDVSIQAAKSGEEALQFFQKNDFDLVLMDIHMPGIGGIGAAKKIRDLENLDKTRERTPIIALTANIVKSEILKFLDSGMDDYIPKPYKVEEILRVICQYFK